MPRPHSQLIVAPVRALGVRARGVPVMSGTDGHSRSRAVNGSVRSSVYVVVASSASALRVRLPCRSTSVTMKVMTTQVTTAKVSHRGQTSLPAGLRHRWGIEDGGEVAFVDLGDAALVLPGGEKAARAELRRRLLDDGAYEVGVAALTDPDLADQ